MPDRNAIEATIRAYCTAWDLRDRSLWLGAFRKDATQEDPIGGRVRRGHEEIGTFFDEALEHWSMGLTIRPERMHVLGLDAAMVSARIATVRAYWEEGIRRRFRT